MPRRRSKIFPPRTGDIVPVAFARHKYGPEVLVDCAWIREMPTFIRPYPHTLGFYDILLITRGSGYHTLDGRKDAVRPNRVFFLSPGEVRDWRVSDLEGLCLFFPGDFLEEFFSDPLFLYRLPYFHTPNGAAVLKLSPAQAGRLKRQLLAMRRELRHLKSDSAHLLRAQLYEALITLARQYQAAQNAPEPRAPHRVALRFREMIPREGPRTHRIAQYARQLGVSPNHLNAICKQHLGRNAKNILQDYLAVQARRLLLYSDETAERIGYSLGFREPSYFTRFFRRRTGRNPTAFRKAHS